MCTFRPLLRKLVRLVHESRRGSRPVREWKKVGRCTSANYVRWSEFVQQISLSRLPLNLQGEAGGTVE